MTNHNWTQPATSKITVPVSAPTGGPATATLLERSPATPVLPADSLLLEAMTPPLGPRPDRYVLRDRDTVRGWLMDAASACADDAAGRERDFVPAVDLFGLPVLEDFQLSRWSREEHSIAAALVEAASEDRILDGPDYVGLEPIGHELIEATDFFAVWIRTPRFVLTTFGVSLAEINTGSPRGADAAIRLLEEVTDLGNGLLDTLANLSTGDINDAGKQSRRRRRLTNLLHRRQA